MFCFFNWKGYSLSLILADSLIADCRTCICGSYTMKIPASCSPKSSLKSTAKESVMENTNRKQKLNVLTRYRVQQNYSNIHTNQAEIFWWSPTDAEFLSYSSIIWKWLEYLMVVYMQTAKNMTYNLCLLIQCNHEKKVLQCSLSFNKTSISNLSFNSKCPW